MVLSTSSRSRKASLVLWLRLISFAICLPLFIVGLVDSTNVFDEATRACFPAHRTFKIYGSFVAFFIPLLIMIVTYALTMSALQQAHSTKKKRYTRRQKMHAVLNLATMAMRWKRAINNDSILEEKASPDAKASRPEHRTQSVNLNTSVPMNYQRKRASSLLVNEPSISGTKHLSKRIFVSNCRLNESSKPLPPISWYKQRDKQLQPLPERSSKRLHCFLVDLLMWISLVEQSSPSSARHLDPGSPTASNVSAKRSHSCTPLLEVEGGRKDRRRSSSVHTLLQIRRDSAKISEELANLSAQLSAAMNTGGTTSKRPSLSVPGTGEDGTPTIDQLLAETSVNQPILGSHSYLTVDSNLPSSLGLPLARGRS